MTTNKPAIILVLGMHRSGTSLVAQLVAKWGAFMGDDLMPADWYNQEGYWEYNPLVNLNEKILAYCNSTWYSPPATLDVPLLLNIFGNEAHALIDEMDKSNTFWCWKDPRMGILLPFWKEILKNRKVIFILSHRNPLEVAASLNNRERFPTFVSIALWEITIRLIIKELPTNSHLFFCEYEQLIANPGKISRELFDFLNVTFHQRKEEEVFKKMQNAINVKLRHAILPANIYLDKSQHELAQLLIHQRIVFDSNENDNRIKNAHEILCLFRKSNYYIEHNFYSRLFFSTEIEKLTKENSIIKKFEPHSDTIIFESSSFKNINYLRFDPINDWAFMALSKVELYFGNNLICSISDFSSNATKTIDEYLFFATQDPHLFFNLSGISFDKIAFTFNYKMYGTECKTFFAENIGLFFENMVDGGKFNPLPDNSFQTLYNQLDERINNLNNSYSNCLKIIEEKENKIEDINKQVVILQNINRELNEDIYLLNEQLIEQRNEINTLNNLATLNNEKNNSLSCEVIDKEKNIEILKYRIETQNNELLEKTHQLDIQNEEIKVEKELYKQEIKDTNNKLQRLMFNERVKLVKQYKRRLPNRLLEQFLSFCHHPFNYYRNRRDTITIRRSGLFDDSWYLNQYSDLYLSIVDLLQHYMRYGWKEKRNPNPLFNATFYLESYPDIEKAGINPLLHFIRNGWKEGRNPHPLFDTRFYLESNPDVKKAGINPLFHFIFYGWKEMRDPHPMFNTNFYLESNPDVKKSGINPLIHYVLYGINENRARIASIKVDNDNRIKEKSINDLKIEFKSDESIIKNDNLRRFFFTEPTPLHIIDKLINYNHITIHWVIPDFSKGNGGHMTIFRIIKELESKGYFNTIWIYNISHHSPKDAYNDIVQYYQNLKAEVKFIDDDFKSASGDIIFASDWGSVAYVNSARNFKRRFYFVQDHESEFNATGSLSLLAQQTYNYDLDCICAGKWLEKIVSEKYGRWARSFNLAIDHTIYNNQSKNEHDGKVRIAFYSRFSTPRRAVELAFLALERLAKVTNNFEVHCFGAEQFIQYAPFECYWHGILKEQELAGLYNYCDVGIVFSATNYSLVPQEMMACGLAVAEIDTECNRIVYPESSITLLSLDPSKMVNQLNLLINDKVKREEQVNNALNWIKDLTWKKSGKQCHEAIIERLKELGFTKTEINHRTRRLAIFASHDIESIIDPYVIFYIKALSQFCDIIYVTDYTKEAKNIPEIKDYLIKYINVHHNEYDFGSYKRGYAWASENLNISEYDWIILCNDSVFGPLFDLSKIVVQMEESHTDFWGFTKNNVDIIPHLQSYFVALNKEVFLSDVFKNFISSIKEEKNKRDIVIKYEHYLTKNLVDAGFTHTAFFEEEDNRFNHDPMKDWNDMILSGFPFIKKRLFTENEYDLKNLEDYEKYIQMSNSTYDPNFILKNLKRTFLDYKKNEKISKIKEIFIHVGLPKTGSTSIQWYLFNSKEELAKESFLYPSILRMSHSTFFYNCCALEPESFRFNKIEAYSKFDIDLLAVRMTNKLIAEVNRCQNIRKLVFSGEEICFLNKTEFESIKNFLNDLFPESTIKIIFFTRNPEDFYTSGIQQIIRSGEKKFKQLWLENKNMFRNNIEKFREIFGASNVIVRSFDKSINNKNGIIGTFLDCIGLISKDEINLSDIKKNTSYSKNAIDIIQYINELVPLYWDESLHTINPDRIALKFNKLSKLSGPKFTLDQEFLDEIWENQEDDLQWLKKEFGIEYQRTKKEKFTSEITFDDTYYNEICLIYPQLSAKLKELILNYFKDKMNILTDEESKSIVRKILNVIDNN